MITLNQEFIEKTKEHEREFLEDRILVQTKEDWEELKATIYHLGDLYAKDERESIIVQNCRDYLSLMWQSMKRIENSYKNNINEANLKTIVYQLKALCRFYHLIFYRRELAENYELEKNQGIPYLDVTDILNRSYRIKKSDFKNFEDSCQNQMKLKNEYVQAHIFIYGTRKEKINLLESYIRDAENLKKEFLEGKIQIFNIEQWYTLKERINAFKRNYDALHSNLEVTEKMKVNKNVSEKFIDSMANYIDKVEERYNRNISANDLTNIMENLYTICQYNYLIEEKDRIIFSTKHIQKIEDEKETTLTSTGAEVRIKISQAEVWKKLDREQKQLQDKYNEAYAFIFGDNLEEAKRGM